MFTPYQGRLFHKSFKVHVTLSWYIQSREEITDQSHEDRNVIRDDLRDVKVTQRTHKHLILRAFSVTSLEGTSDNQNRLDSAETPVIMILNVGRGRLVRHCRTLSNFAMKPNQTHIWQIIVNTTHSLNQLDLAIEVKTCHKKTARKKGAFWQLATGLVLPLTGARIAYNTTLKQSPFLKVIANAMKYKIWLAEHRKKCLSQQQDWTESISWR